jgi:hypothetical protein
MKTTTIIALAAIAAAMAGCKSIEVERKAQSLATIANADGTAEVVRDAAGNPIVLDGGWSVDYFQHWNWQEFDSLSARAGQAELAINNYRGGADATNLTALVDASAKGAALLAERIAAAIATSGGSAATDAISAAVKKYVSAGGDLSKTDIKCENGKCTVTDGTVSECVDCAR